MKQFIKKIYNFSQSDILIRVLIIVFLLSMISFAIFYILYKIYCEAYLNSMDITFFIGSTKDIFQIFFFVVVGLVTILSYLQARKTLFTPIKTETFKMQIKAFEDILIFFQNKTETDFTKQFDLDKILQTNSNLMFTEFLKHFHKDEFKIDNEKIEELLQGYSGAVATKTFFEKHFTKPEYFDKVNVENEEDEILNPALVLEKWKNFEYGPIRFSDKYSDEIEKLNQLIASPLIPIELKNKLVKFDKAMSENLFAVGTVLNEIAQELPTKFPTSKSVKKFDLAGIWNRYHDNMQEVESIAKEILLYIREYLKIDSLIK